MALSGAAIAVTPSEKGLAIKDQVTMSKPYIACPTKDDLHRVYELAVDEKDNAAAQIYVSEHNCHMVDIGAVGIIEDQSTSGTDICVRFKGDPDCQWTPFSVVDKTASQ